MERIRINQKRRGFTLLELVIVIAIMGLVTAVALPGYADYQDELDNREAAKDILLIDQAIHRYWVDMLIYPPDLAAVGMDGMLDPWGNAYIYYRFDETTTPADKRKDKSLNPVNAYYDLYSMGKDEQTHRNFGSNDGRDDIVRANDGRYIGLADDYT